MILFLLGSVRAMSVRMYLIHLFQILPHVQIRLPLDRGQQDPSQSSPHQDYGKSGGEPEESVRAESAMSPYFGLTQGGPTTPSVMF